MKLKKIINQEILQILKDKQTPPEVIQKILGKLTNYTYRMSKGDFPIKPEDASE